MSTEKDNQYLFQRDLELAETLGLNPKRWQGFTELTIPEKAKFLFDILTRLKPHMDNDDWNMAGLSAGDLGTLGSHWRWIHNALDVYNNSETTREAGHDSRCGRVFYHFDNDGTTVHISYSSDGNPEKLLRHPWCFLTQPANFFAFDKIPVTHPEAVKPMGDYLKETYGVEIKKKETPQP